MKSAGDRPLTKVTIRSVGPLFGLRRPAASALVVGGIGVLALLR